MIRRRSQLETPARCSTRALVAICCALVFVGCSSGPFASNRPVGGESFSSNCVTGGLKKSCLPKVCGPKATAIPAPPKPPPGMRIMPSRLVAPVGSEVIVVAGVCAEDGYYTTHERLEWTLDNGSVGQFLVPGERSFPHNLNLIDGGAEKLAPTYAVGYSSRIEETLTRGTATPADDVLVRKGQGWVTVTAASEGTSHITAFAPGVKAWTQHRNTATIHWVDAQWQFPPPAVANPGGRHLLTTTVMRNTDSSPIGGWIVRYDIVSGPPAGFGTNFDQAVEVQTNALGQAPVEIAQRTPASGTNQISIQVIRPSDPASGMQSRITLGTGATTATWGAGGVPATLPQPGFPSPSTPASSAPTTSAASPVSIRASGPPQASVGASTTYTFEVTNATNAAVRGVSVQAALPQALGYQSSNPPAAVAATGLTWQLGDLGVGDTRRLTVNVQPRTAGAVQFCGDVLIGGRVVARGCAATTIGQSQPLEVSIRSENGASQFRVGEDVSFLITLANRGAVPLSGIRLTNTFDAGFTHKDDKDGRGRLFRNIDEGLPANETKQFAVVLRVAKAGRLNTTVEVTATGGYAASATATIDAVDTAGPAAAGALRVSVTGPPTVNVGGRAAFLVDVINTSPNAVTNLVGNLDFEDTSLTVASIAGFAREGNRAIWRIARLEPNQRAQARVEFTAKAPSTTSYCQVTIADERQVLGGGRTNLAVMAVLGGQPAASDLRVNVNSAANPAIAGEDLTYIVNVENRGRADENDVVVQVTLPPNTTMPRVDAPPGATNTMDGRTIRFSPFATLRPLQTATYKVRVRADRPGDYQLEARATSRGVTQPAIHSTTVKVENPR